MTANTTTNNDACQVDAQLERWAEGCLSAVKKEVSAELDWLEGFCDGVKFYLWHPDLYDWDKDTESQKPWCAPWRWRPLEAWTKALLNDEERRTGNGLPDLRELGARWAAAAAEELDAELVAAAPADD